MSQFDLGPGSYKGPDTKPAPSKGGTGKKTPPARKHGSKATVARVRAKKCTACRLCGALHGIHAHHLIPRGMGGSKDGLWTESNIVGLCVRCHGSVESRQPASVYLLRASLTDAEYSYVVTKMGEGWLESRYPVRGVDA